VHPKFIDRLVRRLSGGASAERAELGGDLARAIELWMRAGAVDEAARVMVLRGDAEPDPRLRLQHYPQPPATATARSEISRTARTKKARLTISLAGERVVSSAIRRDLVEAGQALEDAGEFADAADAYARGGDTDAEARALAKGGDVDRLEDVLAREQVDARRGRHAHDTHADIDGLILAGQRREALRIAEASPDDAIARSRASRLRGARLLGPVVRVTLRGDRLSIVLGDEVVIGRTEGAITVASSALSRRHARLAREDGHVVVSDLGSHNGTQLRGQDIALPVVVDEALGLTLGGQVPLRLEPSAALAGATAIEVGGARYVAPLGETRLGVGEWQLSGAADGWVELVTGSTPAFAGGMTLADRVTLLRGDAISSERGGAPVLVVGD